MEERRKGHGKPPFDKGWISQGGYGKCRTLGEGGKYNRTGLTLLGGVGEESCKVKWVFGA